MARHEGTPDHRDLGDAADPSVGFLYEVFRSTYRTVPGPAPYAMNGIAIGFLAIGIHQVATSVREFDPKWFLPFMAGIGLLGLAWYITTLDRSEEIHASAVVVSVSFMLIAAVTMGLILIVERPSIGDGFDWPFALYAPLATGAVVGAPTGMVLDGAIARQQRLERRHRQIEHLNQRLTVVNRVLRHNIRNELTVALGGLEQLQEDLPEDQNEMAERSTAALRRLLEHSEKMLELNQVGPFDADPVGIDLVQYLETFLASDPFDETEGTIEYDLPPEATVRAHPLIGTAVIEVIENALEHSGGDVHVRISLSRSSDTVSLEVTDTGPGIPQQELRALELGHEDALSHGSGVGLWFVKWVTDASNGVLSIDTNGGTAIRLTLPRNQP